MGTGARLSVFLLLLLALNANGKLGGLKLCVVGNPRLRSTRTTKYCDLLGKSKRTPVTCVYGADRLECLGAVSRGKADFSVFEAEDLYLATLWEESSLLVVSEIRALKEKPFRHGMVVVVRRDGNLTEISGLRGRRLCHPGSESGPDWNHLLEEFLEERVAPSGCDGQLSVYEDRIKATSEFFGSACKAGPWSVNPEEDVRLKRKYWNLCELCEGGDCGPSDKYRGSGGSLICFKDGVGDVLWTRHEDIRAHMKFLESEAADPGAEYGFLCEDGRLMPLESEEPCLWVAKPWQVVGANRKSALDVQKLMDALSDEDHHDWEDHFLHVIELYLEYVRNLLVSRTPEDYLGGIPGYLSASAMSQGNCKPRRSVRFCVSSALEEEKCGWMSKAGSAVGVQPPLECLRKDNLTACLDSVAQKEADAVTVPPDYLYDAAVNLNLRSFLLEAGTQFSANYLSCIVVKKESPVKKLSELRGRKICLTRKHGVGWWSLLTALYREFLVGSPCEGAPDRFGEVCFVAEGRGPAECCKKQNDADGPDAGALRCLAEDKCDAAVVDLNALRESPDFRTVGPSSEGAADSYWLWSHPHYLVTWAEPSSPRGEEILNVFFRLGEYFGRGDRKGNSMLEIFGPFRQAKDVLFKDESGMFVSSSRWNRANDYLNLLPRMRVCSEASPSLPPPSSLTLIVVAASVVFTPSALRQDKWKWLKSS